MEFISRGTHYRDFVGVSVKDRKFEWSVVQMLDAGFLMTANPNERLSHFLRFL